MGICRLQEEKSAWLSIQKPPPDQPQLSPPDDASQETRPKLPPQLPALDLLDADEGRRATGRRARARAVTPAGDSGDARVRGRPPRRQRAQAGAARAGGRAPSGRGAAAGGAAQEARGQGATERGHA
ncbi:hypothetical protein BBAD15_g11095 [Beauveria bassiana D1-5]|uniref:Uncharacterized protein n=1 Tax=Beauveria bassiana D1-5 TaxID=1245745 RepID=A0A0A2VCA6_BEABA|nr:hypothetical protein BBAD15_g11095 [Beauveria bassiana D1-5]